MRYTADLCGMISQSLKALQGYGIMALELIQNADDAGASYLSFEVREDALLVRNSAAFTNCGQYGEVCAWERNGRPSGSNKACNIHAVSTMGARSKFESSDQIGRFGIGFVSVFQITDTPIIRSGDCELILNPIDPGIEPKIIPQRRDTEFELPWANSETPVRAALNASPVPPDIVELVLDEFLEAIGSSMLFLRHLEVVEIFRAGHLVERITVQREADTLTFLFGSSGTTQQWLLLKTSAQPIIEARKLLKDFPQLDTHNRSTEVTLAVSIDGAPIDGRLFAYLPTQQSSRLPLHLNADFYPESSRKDIVLRGRGQERQWNEALIAAGAELIGSAFDQLKERLGPVGLWNLGKSCLEQQNDEIFGCYWRAFKAAAQRTECVLSVTRNWLQPKAVFFSDQEYDDGSSQVLSQLGLPLTNEQLRSFWNSLEAAGVRLLKADMIISAITQRAPARDESMRPFLPHIWRLVGKLVEQLGDAHRARAVEQLQSTCFLLYCDGKAAAPKDVWRLPRGVEVNTVLKFIPDCPIVSPEAAEIGGISCLLEEYHLAALATDLDRNIETEEMARERIGDDGDAAAELYSLLLQFPSPSDPSQITELLSSVPFLRTATGYITPERAQLPGGFEDPTGYIEFLDVKHFPPEMDAFALRTLGVRVLSFAEYLRVSLPNIVKEHGLKQESFRSIAEQIARQRRELAGDGVLQDLSRLSFIPTRANTLVTPRDCYRWNADAERVLGTKPENWLDEDWLPLGRQGRQFHDILEIELGMPSRPTLVHMLRRIKEIAATGTVNDETVKALDIVVDRVCTHFSIADPDERRSIASLKDTAFIPALRRGERDESRLYRPHEVYRAARAPGFESQVPVVELNALRRAGRNSSDLMDLVEMPKVPAMAVIVSHLRYCVANGTKVSGVTYDLLNEAVVAERDLQVIKVLAEEPYILNPDTDGYLKATEVFWSAPGMGRYWKIASPGMHRHAKLHEFLGVRQNPCPEDYAELMVTVCGDPSPDPSYREIHERCVLEVCRALEFDIDGASQALEILAKEVSLINRGGDPVFPEDALWIDRPYLAEPFGADLDELLVEPPQSERANVSRFYNGVGVKPLSSFAVQKLAEQPDRRVDVDATALLRNRAALLLWLAPNEATRSALSMAFDGLEVALTNNLMVQVELKTGAVAVVSPPATAHAYLENGMLHVRAPVMNQNAWTTAFRQIFLSIAHYCPQTDIKPLAPTAVLVIRSDSREEAEAALIASDFSPPISGWKDTNATPLGDLEPWNNDEDLAGGPDDDGRDDEQPGGPTDNSTGSQFQNPVSVSPPAPRAHETGASRSREHQVTLGRAHNPPGDATGNTNTAIPIPRLEPKAGDSGRSLEDPAVADGLHVTVPADDDYNSKAGGKPLGVKPDDYNTSLRNPNYEGSGAEASAGRQSKPKSSRMLAYVSRSGDSLLADSGDLSDGLSKEIDARAIERAMRYEVEQGRSPVEQDHFNPGFDIVSTEPSGTRRLIEVKGLRGQWNERGTKLTRTQFSMAQTHADEFWLYVVESALDPNAQQLYGIRNPFRQVDEYWFDSAWKGAAERLANTVQLNARVGARVLHEFWGNGNILEIDKKGHQISAVVDFGYQGKKLVPFTILKFID
jgi:hypothetical protein